MSRTLEPLVALNLTGLVGSVLYRRLVERFGSAEAALRAPEARLRELPGVGPVTAAAIVQVARASSAARDLELADRHGIDVIPFESPEFPAPLRTIYDPPLVVYRKGAVVPSDTLAVGVVGSRRCSDYGERQAGKLSFDLASLGVTVVSGLARGIDTAAHGGALRAREGRTIAVLGSGLLRLYPPENRRIFDAICLRGWVVSEFGLTAGPEPSNFPRRNRIISGLSLGVVVVEAEERSGALITADWAMEQGREVFALPGSVESPMSRGTHHLIRQGAKLVACAADMLEEIPVLAPVLARLPQAVSLSPIERTVLAHVEGRPRTVEEVVALSRLPESSVAAALASLEAKRCVCRKGAGVTRTLP